MSGPLSAKGYIVWFGSATHSITTPDLQGQWFNSELGLCLLVHMGFPFPSYLPKTALYYRWIACARLPLGVNVYMHGTLCALMDQHCIQSVFPPHDKLSLR